MTFWAQNNFHDYKYLINNEHVCKDKDGNSVNVGYIRTW